MDTVTVNRHSTRLPGVDYAQHGAYFVTVCAHQSQPIFGHVEQGNMSLNAIGQFAQECWYELAPRFSWIELDEFVVMPNHCHGIVVLRGIHSEAAPVEPQSRLRPGTLGLAIGQWKCQVTRRTAHLRRAPPFFAPVLWQRNYYERIIRNERELLETRRYIIENPIRWENRKREAPPGENRQTKAAGAPQNITGDGHRPL